MGNTDGSSFYKLELCNLFKTGLMIFVSVSCHISMVLISLVSFKVIAFDDLKTDYKNPIDLCQTLNPVSKFLQSFVF